MEASAGSSRCSARDVRLHVRLHRPPPAGLFLGKFYAFSAVIDRGWTWLAIVGVAATVVSVYYYLGLVRAMWFSGPQAASRQPGVSPPRDPP